MTDIFYQEDLKKYYITWENKGENNLISVKE